MFAPIWSRAFSIRHTVAPGASVNVRAWPVAPSRRDDSVHVNPAVADA